MKTITYQAIKEKDKPLRVVNSKAMREELDDLPAGRYVVTVEKKKKHKSQSQLGYYFAGVLPAFRNFALDAGWEFESLEEVDIYLKSLFADREIVNRETGEMLKIPALKRNMTTTEFMVFINHVRDWCSEFLGGYIPSPEENIKIAFDEVQD